MKKTITKDGSITFFNEKYSDYYHSTSGAIEESFLKFAMPAKIREGMNILDICFGLGYNSLAALCLATVKIAAVESDPIILEKIQSNRMFDYSKGANKAVSIRYNNKKINSEIIKKNYDKIKKVAKEKCYKDNEAEIKLILGDARKTVKKLRKNFDVVFLDPFSPKKCPELWTKEFFKSIFDVMKSNSILTTYSCASLVRNNLKEVGFIVKDGPVVGRRSPATVAYKMNQQGSEVINFQN